MEDKFLPLESEEVISVDEKYKIAYKIAAPHTTPQTPQTIFTVSEFLFGISRYLKNYFSETRNIYWDDNQQQQWFTDKGVEGRALRYGAKGWQSGRLRLSIEFCPDEPEPEPETPELTLLEASIESTDSPADSPLDEIRRLAEE
jgi:hypothetical protein